MVEKCCLLYGSVINVEIIPDASKVDCEVNN